MQNNIPQVLCRKNVKDYGTKKVIEGIWLKGHETLIVEDVVTYGDSIAECAGVSIFIQFSVMHFTIVSFCLEIFLHSKLNTVRIYN